MPTELNMVIGIDMADTSATRRGISNTTTMITDITDISNSRRKFTTDSLTTLLWSVIMLRRTSFGSSCLKSSICLRTSLPIFTMSLPGRISTESSTHFLPFDLMYLSICGYSRTIRATSFRRITSPVGVE